MTPLILTFAGLTLWLYSQRPGIAHLGNPWPKRISLWASFACSLTGGGLALFNVGVNYYRALAGQ